MKVSIKTTITFFSFAVSMVVATHCYAQVSFFDPTFGSGGKTIIPLGTTEHGVFDAIALQTDGKIVVAGIMTGTAVIARFKENGKIDSSFGVNGYYTGPTYSRFYDLILQPDGKILAEGNISFGAGNTQFFTLRLRTDGSPDVSFGMSGIVSTDFGPFTNNYGYAIAIQSDGKIVISGEKDLTMGIARLNNNGLLDSSFGTNGLISGPYGKIRGIVITPDGKIVVGGHATAAHDYALMAVRYLTDGTPDTSFNHTGIVYTIAGEPDGNFGKALNVQPDGKVLLAGSGGFGAEGGNFVVVRYNTDGSLDGSFGSGGIADVDFYGQDDGATDMRIAPDGKIILAGNTGDNVDYAITRLNSNGTVDNTFGNAGRIVVPIRYGTDYAGAVALQADGKIVVAGHCVKDTTLPYTDPVITRLLPYHTGVNNEIVTDDNVLLFPNPASEIITIKNSYENVIAEVSAVDMAGKTICIGVETGKKQIAVNNLPNGMYLFRVLFECGQEIVQKVWVRHK